MYLPAASPSSGSPTITYGLTGLPAGLSFNSSTRRISGTPTSSNVSGTLTYTAQAVGYASAQATGSYTVNAGERTSRVQTIYRRATSTPGAPAGGQTTENHVPSPWTTSEPAPTQTENVYSATRTVRYLNGVFESATAWGGVTEEAAKTGTTPPAPTGVAGSASTLSAATHDNGVLRHLRIRRQFGFFVADPRLRHH